MFGSELRFTATAGGGHVRLAATWVSRTAVGRALFSAFVGLSDFRWASTAVSTHDVVVKSFSSDIHGYIQHKKTASGGAPLRGVQSPAAFPVLRGASLPGDPAGATRLSL